MQRPKCSHADCGLPCSQRGPQTCTKCTVPCIVPWRRESSYPRGISAGLKLGTCGWPHRITDWRCVLACAAKRSPMASRMLQPVLMTPNADTNEEGQSKVRSAMQARIYPPALPSTDQLPCLCIENVAKRACVITLHAVMLWSGGCSHGSHAPGRLHNVPAASAVRYMHVWPDWLTEQAINQ